MNLPDDLRVKLEARATSDPQWFPRGYEEAVARIDEHGPDEPGGPCCHAKGVSMDALGNGDMTDEFGGDWTPDDVRRQAFEMLALADLAEVLKARS